MPYGKRNGKMYSEDEMMTQRNRVTVPQGRRKMVDYYGGTMKDFNTHMKTYKPTGATETPTSPPLREPKKPKGKKRGPKPVKGGRGNVRKAY